MARDPGVWAERGTAHTCESPATCRMPLRQSLMRFMTTLSRVPRSLVMASFTAALVVSGPGVKSSAGRPAPTSSVGKFRALVCRTAAPRATRGTTAAKRREVREPTVRRACILDGGREGNDVCTQQTVRDTACATNFSSTSLENVQNGSSIINLVCARARSRVLAQRLTGAVRLPAWVADWADRSVGHGRHTRRCSSSGAGGSGAAVACEWGICVGVSTFQPP